MTIPPIPVAIFILSIAMLFLAPQARAQMVTGSRMRDFDKTFDVTPVDKTSPFEAHLIARSAPGNILWPGEQPTLTIRIVSHEDVPIQAAGQFEVIAYGAKGIPGDVWTPVVFRTQDAPVAIVPVTVTIAPHGS